MTTKSWNTFSVQFPDTLENSRELVNDIFDWLNFFLEIANQALEFAKSFLIAYIDPLSALLQALMTQIKGFLDSLRGAGIYLTGDWALLSWPPENLRGGYQAYETRMISRLTDRTDSTRPDIPDTQNVTALFTYASADTSSFERLYATIQALLKLFSLQFWSNDLLPTPTIKEALYGTDATNIFDNLSSVIQLQPDPPNVCRIIWTTPTNGRKTVIGTIPSFPPTKYLITVSTLKDPIDLYIARPQSDSAKQDGQQGRDVQAVRDLSGKPVKLYGGADTLDFIGSSFEYNAGFKSDGTLKDNTAQVFGKVRDQIIPLELLKDDDGGGGNTTTYYIQKTWELDLLNVGLQYATEQYSVTLNLEDLPHVPVWDAKNGQITVSDGGLTDTYYVRIASTTSSADYRWSFKNPVAKPQKTTVNLPFTISNSPTEQVMISGFSEPFTLTFPAENTQEFLFAIKTALLVLVLTRSDLQTKEELEALRGGVVPLNATGIAGEPTGLEPFKGLVNLLYWDISELEAKGGDPLEFRLELDRRIEKVAREVYQKMGANRSLERAIVDATTNLRSITWKDLLGENGQDLTLYDGVTSTDTSTGLAANIYSSGLPPEQIEPLFFEGWVLGRAPGFLEWAEDPFGFVTSTSTTEETSMVLEAATPALKEVYQQSIFGGLIQVGERAIEALQAVSERRRKNGSYDLAPVWVNGKAMTLVRSPLQTYNGGVICSEAKQVLSLISSILRAPEDGEWISVRFLGAFPELEDFTDSVMNWLKSLESAAESAVDTLIKYIEFLQGAITDLQQLLQRINGLIQQFLSMVFVLPPTSALVLTSKGTNGILQDFMNAENKPRDSAFSFGAGVCAVCYPSIKFFEDIFSGDGGNSEPASGVGIENNEPTVPALDVDAL